MVFRALAKDSLIYGGADLFTKILSFFSFPLIAAVLSPKVFGELELIFTVTALLGLAINCGLNNAVQRFYWDTDTPEEKRKIVTSGVVSQVVFGLFAIFIGFLLIPLITTILEQKAWPISWLTLFSAILLMVFTQWLQYILDVVRLHFKPWRFFVLALVSRVFVVIAGVISVVYLHLGVDGLLASQAIISLLILPFGYWLIRGDLSIVNVSWPWCKKLVKFGYPFIFAGLAYWLFSSMDRWMLATMTTVDEVGIYSVAFRFASIVFFVSIAFGQAWSPRAMKIKVDMPNQYRYIYGKVLQVLVFLMLIAGGGVAMFSGEIISLVMPKIYQESALPLAILCFGIVVQSTQQITAIGISIEKKTFIFARVAWCVAGINFLGNWFLIPLYGAVGAAWATLFSYMLLTLSYLYFTQRLHRIYIPWRRMLVLVLLGIAIALISVLFIATEFNIKVFFIKLSIAILCLSIGWRSLSIHSLKGL